MKKRRIHYLYYTTLTKREKKINSQHKSFLKAVCSTFITVFDIMENKTIHSMILCFFVIGFFFVPSSVTFFSCQIFFRFFFFISHVRSLKNIIAKERLMKRMSSISFCRDIHSVIRGLKRYNKGLFL